MLTAPLTDFIMMCPSVDGGYLIFKGVRGAVNINY
jgi:hypothetical protein